MAASEIARHGRGIFSRVIRHRGFTLLELMIVVAIIAILASVAYPSYINYIVKTKRNAASACLSQYANYMERYYTTNLRYDQTAEATPVAHVLPTLDCAADSQTGEDYLYAFAASPALSQSTFKITAAPQNAQSTRDTKCAVLGIDQSGQRFYKSTLVDEAGVAECW